MTITTRRIGNVTILDCAGRFSLGEGPGSTRFPDTISELVERGEKRILVNMANVTYADSSGTGALVAAFTAVTNQGGQLKLLNLTRRIEDLLQIKTLYAVFEVFDGEAEALRGFAH